MELEFDFQESDIKGGLEAFFRSPRFGSKFLWDRVYNCYRTVHGTCPLLETLTIRTPACSNLMYGMWRCAKGELVVLPVSGGDKSR